MNDFEKQLKVYATLTNTLDKYVYLRKDEKGIYVEYAFLEDAPHDNRCLSWYDSLQPEAMKRNRLAFGGSSEDAKKDIANREKLIEKKLNKIHKLASFTCGYEENPEVTIKTRKRSWELYHKDEEFIEENHICKVGKPAPKCIKDKTCSHWTYNEPVKCACWVLVDVDNIDQVPIPIDTAVELFDKILELKEGKS